jgi:diguanylate cyclase (GGDEF)-like protein/PAS domain S-box-containing protein
MLEKKKKHKANAALESLSLLKATLESTADGILVVNTQGIITSYNQKFRKMWGIPDYVLANREDEKAVSYVLNNLKDPTLFVEKLKTLYENPDSDCFDEIELKDGRIFERYSIPQKMGSKVVGRVFSFRDVTERKLMEQQLLYQATHDSLTSLPNRSLLYDRINESIKIAKRHRYLIGICLFDLNRFKGINDSLGHEAGDMLLQMVAKRMQGIIRETDTLARLGGDEFVLLVTELNDQSEMVSIIERCLSIFNEPFKVYHHMISTSASMGISVFPTHGSTSQELLKYADAAMYYAKGEGHKGYKFYGPYMTDKAVEILDLENDLHAAIQNEQFRLFYQPIIDLEKGSIQGAEALLRWMHPTKGIISPDQFIPLAEETGLILPIGSWVLKEVVSQVKIWEQAGLLPLVLSFNVSTLQFKDANFLPEIETTVEAHKINPHFLQIEITETGLMSNVAMFSNTLEWLKIKGIALAVDDFGTGYSNLSYLTVLPLNKLKIDKSFIQDSSEKGRNIALSILALAKKLNLKVVAEGVETKEQIDFLKQNQCDEVQGYYFSKPVESKHFINFVRENRILNEIVPIK